MTPAALETILANPLTRKWRRRGGMYVTVLGASMFVTMIGLAALTAARVQARSSTGQSDVYASRLAARSAIEFAMDKIANYDDWRTRFGGAHWQHTFDFGGGTGTVSATDPVDADLADSFTDSVLLQGIGEVGGSRQILQVTLQSVVAPLEALNTCLHTLGNVTVSIGPLTVQGAPLSTNANAQIDAALTGDLHAATRSGIGTVSGATTVPADAKPGPADSVFADYQSLATAIVGITSIEAVVLSPGSNPWGATNADGVYKITSDKNITIRDMRLHGTLVISSPGKTVTIEKPVLMQPFRTDYPTLIVQAGELSLKSDRSVQLSEAALAKNFNPAGTPYGGVSDTDQSDVYPNEIHGLVHVIGNVTLKGPSTVRGTLLCTGWATSSASAEIIHDPSLYQNPPVGYSAPPTMIIAQQSWRQAVDP